MIQDPIAIIGAACRLPGARTPKELWDIVSTGRDVVTEIPDDRWSKSFYFHPNPAERGKTYTWAAGIVDDIDRFDAAFFGISPREAEQIDPQQRMLLELAWEALEDAGIAASKIAGDKVGVYIGASSGDYGDVRIGDPASGDAYFMTGVTASILANRVSYIFDLHGPSFVVDTACSSSLVALELACSAIAEKRVPMALVGGVSLLLSPFPFIGFCRASMLSPDGRCHAFDARANGYVRAEGGGMVALKPLSQALADGDRVRAVIYGAAVNSDGRTLGLSLPNRAAQADLLRQVYSESGVDPHRLGFIEAHGTGTAAGDPIEVAALGLLARGRDTALPIGSVKTNLGHLEAASGMAGLIKSVLALENRMIPPSLHFETPNPRIPFDDLNITVATRLLSLPERGPLLAGVNSFGFGGTNAHIILGSAPEHPIGVAHPRHWSQGVQSSNDRPLPPLLISARSENSLKALARDWSDRLADASADSAAPLLRAAARRRDHHRLRLVAWGATPLEIADSLDAMAAPAAKPVRSANLTWGPALVGAKLAFVFSGNGVQRAGMARDALRHSPGFRAALEWLDSILERHLGWSVVERLTHDADPRILARTDVAQPLLFAIQVATVTALREAGVHAQGHVGHSVGEIAAGWAAGALSIEDACRIIVARSVQQQRTAGSGAMAAIGLSCTQAEELLSRLGGGLGLAAINSSAAVTVAGPHAAFPHLEAAAAAEGFRYTRLDLDYAFHSAALDPIQHDLLAALDGIAPRDCADDLASTVEGDMVAGRALDGRYWWRNIREPVRFRGAVDRMIADGYRIFVEIGPNPALLSYLRDGLRTADVQGRVFGTLSHRIVGTDPLPAIVAECHTAGGDISGAAIFDGATDTRRLPKYPWDRARHWFQKTTEGIFPDQPAHDHPLLGYRRTGQDRDWTNLLSLDLHPWIGDHRVEQAAVAPGAALVEIALAAARHRFPDAPALEISGFEISRALTLEPGQSRTLRVRETEAGGLEIASRLRLSEDDWAVHAIGRIGAAAASPPTAAEPEVAVLGVIAAEAIYDRAERMGLNYGPGFRVVLGARIIGDGQARIALDPTVAAAIGPDFILNPVSLDGALQGLLALLSERMMFEPGETFIPARFGRVRVFRPFGRMATEAVVTIGRSGTRSLAASLRLLDANGEAIAEADECWFQRVRLSRANSPARIFRFVRIAAPLPDESWVPPIDPKTLLAPDPATPDAGARYGEAAALFDAFLAAVAAEAVQRATGGAERFSPDDLIRSGAVAEAAGPLLDGLLDRMERHGVATIEGGHWLIAQDGLLPEPSVIWRTILEDAPELTAELALAAGADVGRMLRDGLDAAPPSPALVEQMFYASPSGRGAIRALADAVAQLSERWPRNRPLRIIEIGAGSGALTRRVLDRLSGWDGTLRYVVTDPDPQRAQLLAAQAPAGVTARPWNPNDTSTPSRLQAGEFDLAIMLYGVGRQQFGPAAIARIGDALAPGGVILGAEPEASDVWNAIFAQLPESRHPAPANPRIALTSGSRKAGFVEIATRPVAGAFWPVSLVAAKTAPREPRDPGAVASDPVVVIAASADRLALELVARLEALGVPARLIDPPEIADGAALCAALAGTGAAPPRIIALPLSRADIDGAAGIAERMVALLTVARLTADSVDSARFWIVTRDAHHDDAPSPTEAAVWGLGRTIMNEMAQLGCRLIDLPAGWSAEVAAGRLADELTRSDDEREIVWTASGRQALRLRQGLPGGGPPASSVALAVARPGLLDTLGWRASTVQAPAAGEVAIAVAACGLNFRDVMWAMALLPEEALLGGFSGPTLGLECAGTITAVGEGVAGLAVGDRVLALAPAALRTHVVTKAHAVVAIPDGLGFPEAATIPVACLTVLYALETLARLEPGESILIHGGAGGVGLAAIQYARHRGATIFATAGSAVKRAFLAHLGVDHVLDSRSLAFADAVRELTGGQGVDVVLNSLSGEAMERSLGLLKPFGRFVELGKRDFMMDTRVGLRALRQNIAYHAVDIDRLPVDRPALAARLLSQVVDLVAAGAFRPLPYRSYPFAEAADAFRLMQSSGHIGKIVLTPDGLGAPSAAEAPNPVRGDRTYLVVGGLSGFGLETARWLVRRGARSLALASRRGASAPAAAAALAEFSTAGIEARAFACDAADERSLQATLDLIRASMPPLGGVIHAAMVVDDGLASQLTSDRIARVMAPKLDAALHLDRLTRADPLDTFVLYSSATTLLGAPGQGSYVAANSALEALARRRRGQGLPALAVAWGPIADAGFLADSEAARDALIRRLSTAPIAAAEALDALPMLLASGAPVLAFAPVRWDSANPYLPILASPSFADVATQSAEIGSIDLKETLDALPPAEAKAFLIGLLTEETSRILSFAPDGIDPQRPLSEFGMDSLMAVELRLALQTRLGVDVPLVSLSDNTSLATIAQRLIGTLTKPAEASGGFDDTLARYEIMAAPAAEPVSRP